MLSCILSGCSHTVVEHQFHIDTEYVTETEIRDEIDDVSAKLAQVAQQIKELKVEKTFHLLGKRENPYPYIKQANIFCLLSEFEGYGMVIEEAKILNKPIVITDTAAREAVQNYENSIIVSNNEEAIYTELKEILQKNIKSFSNKQEEYDNSKIITKLEKLLEEDVKTIDV